MTATTRASDLIFAANADGEATLTDADLRPWNSADDMPRREGWVDLRGWEIPAMGTVVLLATWIGVKIIEAVIAALVMISGGM